MKFSAFALFFYAVLVAGLGYIGYREASSIPSLVMGSAFGAILFLCSWGLLQQKTWGFLGGLASSIMLTAVFMTRYMISGKIYPAGMMAIVSLIMIVFLLSMKRSVKA